MTSDKLAGYIHNRIERDKRISEKENKAEAFGFTEHAKQKLQRWAHQTLHTYEELLDGWIIEHEQYP